MSEIDTGYKHYKGPREGIWQRRSVILETGLRACWSEKPLRGLIICAWALTLPQIALLFAVGQVLVPDSILFSWIENVDFAQAKMVVTGLLNWLVNQPAISVGTTYTLAFYFFSSLTLMFPFVAMAMVAPHLVSGDIASRAMVIYKSKAISRFDYVLGKVSVAMVVVALCWALPLIATWLTGNLLAPNWHFIWHSKKVLLRLLIFCVFCMTFLALMATAVSAFCKKPKSSTAVWIGIWLLGNTLVPIGWNTKHWLRYFSFSFDLKVVALHVFNLENELETARSQLPGLSNMIPPLQTWNVAWRDADLNSALAALMVMTAISIWIIYKKTGPES